MSKSDSKKQIAQEFFQSLDQSMPWKLRLSQTIDHMKDRFPKGQTERVVYQHIRDLISEQDRPDPSAQSIKNAILAKIDKLRRHKNETGGSFARIYRNHSLVQKLLMCGDLYSSGWDYNNNNDFYRTSGALIHEDESIPHDIKIDNAVLLIDRLDFTKYPRKHLRLQYSEIFPYFNKSVLESPISLKELMDLSGDLLSQSEAAILEEAFLHGETFPKAIEWLSGEIAKNVDDEIRQDLQSSTQVYESKPQPLPEKAIYYALIIALSLAIFSCIKLNEGGSSVSTESKYIERCMANGTSRSVCSDWYEEIERSVNEQR